jgi:hypothetical protein
MNYSPNNREAVQYLLNNYKHMTPSDIIHKFLENDDIDDANYVFNMLPPDLKKQVDDLSKIETERIRNENKLVRSEIDKIETQRQVVKAINSAVEGQLDHYQELNRQLL